ncbi:MAG: MBL fold metallo-hydrolase, partial [Planctomycetota bacterium]
MSSPWKALVLILVVSVCTAVPAEDAHSLSSSVRLVKGPVNGAFVERGGHVLAIYGDPSQSPAKADMVLFTHSRRDVVWAGRHLVEHGAQSVVPASEASAFTDAREFWKGFVTARFHDYNQQTTKVPITPMRVDRTVRHGDTIQWQDLSLKVLGTPGYTRGALTYLLDVDDTRYAFTGDTIYGDGHLLDLYSLQDAVAEAKIGGYHGYAGRIGQLIPSLRKILAQDADVLVPVRGPVIRNPEAAIAKLIERLQAAYTNYLSINAGRWYFKDRYNILAKRALGDPADVPWMTWAATIEKNPPSWMVPINNSRLILSKTGVGWLIDCGSQAIINRLKEMRDDGRLKSIEGLFVTHYHDDHTDKINAFLDEFPCPVYVTPLMKDILLDPEAYRLPAMTRHPVADVTVMPDRQALTWREFELTFYDYPGQTLYHDALLVKGPNGGEIFFLGDSFTPSGPDDYCLLNRNVMHEGDGYLYCLDVLEALPSDCLLVNQHVLPAFRFDKPQLAHMRNVLTKRKALLAELFPWDEPNYGIDERWARFVPYGQTARPGESITVEVRILNHSDRRHEYTVTPHVPAMIRVEPKRVTLAVDPRQEKAVALKLTVPDSFTEQAAVMTADIAFDDWDLRHWCES